MYAACILSFLQRPTHPPLHAPASHALQEVAAFVGTVHHSFVFTIQEGLDAVREVVHHLETYDVTTVR